MNKTKLNLLLTLGTLVSSSTFANPSVLFLDDFEHYDLTTGAVNLGGGGGAIGPIGFWSPLTYAPSYGNLGGIPTSTSTNPVMPGNRSIYNPSVEGTVNTAANYWYNNPNGNTPSSGLQYLILDPSDQATPNTPQQMHCVTMTNLIPGFTYTAALMAINLNTDQAGNTNNFPQLQWSINNGLNKTYLGSAQTNNFSSWTRMSQDFSGYSGTQEVCLEVVNAQAQQQDFAIDNYCIYTENSALPISLIHFNAVLEPSQVRLSWRTAQETNNKGFMIERSLDGKHFEEINSSIISNGQSNSSSAQSYTHLDTALPSKGTLFYRLKQIDLDGKLTLSHVITVRIIESNTSMTVFPIPANDQMTVQISDTYSDNQINTAQIMSLNGQVLVSMQLDMNQKQITLNTSQIPSGVYTLLIRSEDQSMISKQKISIIH